ncbi:hypothetical protein HaLaN_32007, partial [Haematococcus lacustris]
MRRTAALVLFAMLTAWMSVLADNCTEPVANSSCLALLGKSLDGLRIANVPSLGAVEYNNLTRLLYGCLASPYLVSNAKYEHLARPSVAVDQHHSLPSSCGYSPVILSQNSQADAGHEGSRTITWLVT